MHNAKKYIRYKKPEKVNMISLSWFLVFINGGEASNFSLICIALGVIFREMNTIKGNSCEGLQEQGICQICP
jgi:hypothetical protein